MRTYRRYAKQCVSYICEPCCYSTLQEMEILVELCINDTQHLAILKS